MIDPSPLLEQFTAAIDSAHAALAFVDSGLPDTIPLSSRAAAVSRVPPRPEIVDARALLDALTQAADRYMQRWSPSTTRHARSQWLTAYRPAFELLDRRARHVLALTAPTPPAIPYASTDAAHSQLVSRANAAASSGAPPDTLAELARYRAAFDEAWDKRPVSSAPPEADASTEGVKLKEAMATAEQSIAFLGWAKGNPS